MYSSDFSGRLRFSQFVRFEGLAANSSSILQDSKRFRNSQKIDKSKFLRNP